MAFGVCWVFVRGLVVGMVSRVWIAVVYCERCFLLELSQYARDHTSGPGCVSSRPAYAIGCVGLRQES